MGKASGFLKTIGLVNKHPVVAFVGNVGTALEVGKVAIDVAGSDVVKGVFTGALAGTKRFLGIGVAGAAAEQRPEETPVADVGRPGVRPAASRRQIANPSTPTCRDLLSQQAISLRQQYQQQLDAALANQAQMPAFDPNLYAQFGMPDGGMGYYDPSMYGAPPASYYGVPGVYGVNGLPINPPSAEAKPDVGNATPPENCTPCQLAARRGAAVAGANFAIVVGETMPDWMPDGETADTGCWVSGEWIGDDDDGGVRFVPGGVGDAMPFADYNAMVKSNGSGAWPHRAAWIRDGGQWELVGYIEPSGRWHTNTSDASIYANDGIFFYSDKGREGGKPFNVWVTPDDRVDPTQYKLSVKTKKGWKWTKKPAHRPARPHSDTPSPARHRDPRRQAAGRVIDSARNSYRRRIDFLQGELAKARSANRNDAVSDLEAKVADLMAQNAAAEAAQNALDLDTPEAQALQTQIVLLAQQNPAAVPTIFAQLVTPQAPWGTVPPMAVVPMAQGPAAVLAQPPGITTPLAQPGMMGAPMSPYMDQWGGQQAPFSPYMDQWSGQGQFDPYMDQWQGNGLDGMDWDSLVAMSIAGAPDSVTSLAEIDESIHTSGIAEDLALLGQYGMGYDIPADVETKATPCETGTCPTW